VHGNGRVEIRVEDTGVGINDEDQAKLFGEFARVNLSRRHSAEGTGLGLHLSRKLAEMLGGAITMHSVSGKGSAFTLFLPAR
jgi:signal transduction histidine kinase